MFKINPKLKNAIFKDLPKDSSKLTTALTIYARLCQNLEYSMDYFADPEANIAWYSNPANISKVDGKNHKQVVCYTFNAIYSQLLVDAGVCSETQFSEEQFLRNGKFKTGHESLTFEIDGTGYDVDATYGIINNCDITLSKYGTPTFDGWLVLPEKVDHPEEAEAEFLRARDEVARGNIEFDRFVKSYIFSRGKSYVQMPLQERFDLFLEYLQNTPPYSVQSLNYIIKLKHLLFTSDELGKTSMIQNVELAFVKDATTKQLKTMVLYNPKGYVDDPGFENFDSLQIYEYNLVNQTLNYPVSIEELTEKIQANEYSDQLDYRTKLLLIAPGTPFVSPVPPPGQKLEFDENRQPINVDHYKRTEKLTGKSYVCDKDGNPINSPVQTTQTPKPTTPQEQ